MCIHSSGAASSASNVTPSFSSAQANKSFNPANATVSQGMPLELALGSGIVANSLGNG